MDRVLMVDDDRELFAMMQQYLSLEGFDLSGAHDGQSGIEAAMSGDFAMVLLDVMLPGPNGFEVLRRVREAGGVHSRVPILMLTARGDAIDRIVGLEVGADDYLAKPFNERELVARMRAILRRARAIENTQATDAGAATAPLSPPKNILRVGDIELEASARRAKCQASELELTAVEFDLLHLLMQEAGKVVTRQHIARQVLDRQLLPFDRAIDTHMSNLRRKIGPLSDGGERIKTVRAVGYILTT